MTNPEFAQEDTRKIPPSLVRLWNIYLNSEKEEVKKLKSLDPEVFSTSPPIKEEIEMKMFFEEFVQREAAHKMQTAVDKCWGRTSLCSWVTNERFYINSTNKSWSWPWQTNEWSYIDPNSKKIIRYFPNKHKPPKNVKTYNIDEVIFQNPTFLHELQKFADNLPGIKIERWNNGVPYKRSIKAIWN